MFSDTQITQITNLLNKTKINDEFEVMFNNYKKDNKLSIIKFMNILKYIKYRSEKEKLVLRNEVILDIIFDYEINNSYRVSIYGIKNINEFLNLVHQRSNHILFSILINNIEFIKNDNFKYIRKSKDNSNIIDFDQYDIRIRKSNEEPLTDKNLKELQNISINSSSKINFRYKNRLSLEIINDNTHNLNIDLTVIQSDTNVNNLTNSQKGYEIEIDYTLKKDHTNKNSNFIVNEIETIKKILEKSDYIITKDESSTIINAYKKLVSLNDNINNALYSMQPISAEVQHVVDKIPNIYSVTDKADGEKAQLFIYNKKVYIIDNNLEVIKTKYISDLNNTILEGELIYIYEERKYIYMGFDCLYFKGDDIKDEPSLKKRLNYVNKVCSDINEKIYITKEYDGKFGLDNLNTFYNKEIDNFYKNLKENINKCKVNDIYFHPKFFLFPVGGSNCEVYLYANLIWEYYTNSNMNYKLDGIIFTGLEQKYTRDKKEQRYPIYKYKPPITNSIDVFIIYQRNSETNLYLDIFDNSVGNQNNQIYRITNLFVGDILGNKEVPVPFMKEENNHEAYFPLVNGEVRDQDGNYVQDNTVIEIIYNNDPTIPHQYRWIILKTRWDKTEEVYRNQKKYGNFKDVAEKTWKSIKEAVTIDEIKNLSNPNTFTTQQKLLQTRLNSSVIVSERQQDIYYQKVSNLCKKMRDYHNWIKSIIIYTYCGPLKINKNSKTVRTSVLDIGCGVGGDLLKWYHARVGEYVGIDVDYYGLYSSTNGALSRYEEFKRKFPDFGKVNWIQADPSVPLEASLQENRLPNMTNENKQLITKIFNKKNKYDCISSMFSLHYLFGNKESTSNLILNINNYLKVGGFFICTLFDANQIMDLLGDNNTFTSYYTDDDGSKKKLFEIIKKFDGKLKDEEGLPIDVYLAWIMQDDKYETEYLVTPKLLKSTLEKAGCRLIDTDLFSNLYNLNQSYFTNVINYEENPKNFKFYKRVAAYYEDLKGVDKESKIFTFLNRYYIFQKIK